METEDGQEGKDQVFQWRMSGSGVRIGKTATEPHILLDTASLLFRVSLGDTTEAWVWTLMVLREKTSVRAANSRDSVTETTRLTDKSRRTANPLQY